MHLQSLLLYGLLVLVTARLYRQVMTPTWVAGLATLLFAVDDAHGGAVAWIAARNSLLVTLFGVLALLAHDGWRRHGWRAGAVLGPGAFLLSLLSKEMGVAFGGYLLAHAAFLDRGSWRRRVVGFLPYVAIVLAWRTVYHLRGYGVVGSGMYVDPLGEPLQFALAVVQRMPVLMLGLWGQPPADFSFILPEPVPTVMMLLGTVGLVLLVVLLTPFLRREATARFWAMGMMLSLVPVCAGFAANRYLLIPSLGAMGLVALFLGGWTDGWVGLTRTRAWERLAKGCAVFLFGMHLVLAPLILAYGTWTLGESARAVDRVARKLPNDPALAEQDLVIVNAPDFLLFTGYIFPTRFLDGLPVAKRHAVLTTGPVELGVQRVDERTLLVRGDQGFPSGITDVVYRSKGRPFVPGEQVHLPAMTVEVQTVDRESLVTEALFRFNVPLEDPSLRWVRWDADDGALVPFQPPAMGETTHLPAAIFTFAGGVAKEDP
jgi:hypothetical protein